MNPRADLLYEMPARVASGLGPLFWLLLALFVVFIYLLSRGPKSSMEPFNDDYPLSRLLRLAKNLALSRWWILGVPIMIGIDASNEGQLVRLATKYDSTGPLLQDSFSLSLKGLISLHALQTIRTELISDVTGFLINASGAWQIQPHLIFGVLAPWAVLAWFIRICGQEEETAGAAGNFRIYWALAGIICFPVVIGGFYLFFLTSLGEHYGAMESYLAVLSAPAALLGLTVFTSLWFAVMFATVQRWDERICGSDTSSPPGAFILKIFFRVLPANIFVIVLLGAVSSAITFIPYLDRVLSYWGLNEWFYTAAELTPRIVLFFQVLVIVIGLWLLPLPFLIARHDVKLLRGIRLCASTWICHFRRLVTLLGAAVVLVSASHLPSVIYSAAMQGSWPYPALPVPYKWSAFFQIPFIALRQSALVIFFLLVLIAFQTGALDLPGSAQGESEAESRENDETIGLA